MSQLQVNRINDTSGGVLAPVSSVFRNRIINGAMTIDQRNAGASVSQINGNYNLDRYFGFSFTGGATTGRYTVQQNAGAVTPPAGFTNYLGVTSTSTTATNASNIYTISQRVEGFNVADFGWGTANAHTVTLSFWVRSSLTGTFGGSVFNSAGDRSYPFSYTINAANTWEYETITIVGDTTGTWLTTNGAGLQLNFGLGVGSSFSGTAGAWSGSTLYAPTGATSVVGTNGATFYITGVQLEKGTQATGFEYENYTSLLTKCQRYYYVGTGAAYGYPSPNSGGYASVQRYDFKVTMRTAATVVTAYSSQSNISSINANTRTTDFFTDQIVSSVTTNTTWVASYTASAEL
jgi:hypothetical protein